ncbi:hypothetical protein BDF14DRAFT_413541 [Spinellus fusiger]|nr:hypothetical protein BDF14DRAFT_413541 [Spinellus fusiger]
MHRLIATALVLDKAQSVIVDVYRDHTKLLRMEHFLSLSLTYMGLCSRLYVLITNWTYQLEDCYQLLQRWHVAFPYGLKQKELALFMAETHQQCEPMTMQEARRAYVVRENEARSTLEHPLHFASYAAHLSKLPVLENMSSLEPTMMMEEKGKEKDMGVEAMEDMGEIIQRE